MSARSFVRTQQKSSTSSHPPHHWKLNHSHSLCHISHSTTQRAERDEDLWHDSLIYLHSQIFHRTRQQRGWGKWKIYDRVERKMIKYCFLEHVYLHGMWIMTFKLKSCLDIRIRFRRGRSWDLHVEIFEFSTHNDVGLPPCALLAMWYIR